MRKIIFSKYSNDRNIRFKIHTDILEDEKKKRYVRKVGMNEQANAHLKRMSEKAQRLDKLYRESVFETNRCTYEGNGVLSLEYVSGQNLEQELDAYLREGAYDAFERKVTEYGTAMRALATEPFEGCEKYYEVFGAEAYDSLNAMAMSCSNVDMIFANLVSRDGKWIVLDYEWTFDMKIPVDFILFRTINYYQTPDRLKQLEKTDMYQLLGVSRAHEQIFRCMEEKFQSYVYMGNAPLWRLYETIGKPYYFPAGMVAEKHLREERTKGQVVRFYAGRYTCEAIEGFSDETGNMKLEIACQGCNTLRIDFAKLPCIVIIKRVLAVSETEELPLAYGSNGINYTDTEIYFGTEEPHLLIGEIKESYTKVLVEYNIQLPSTEMFRDLQECVSMLRSKNINLNNQIQAQQQQITQLSNQISSVENSASWKVTKPLRKLKGHS